MHTRALILVPLLLTGCNLAERLSRVGEAPTVSQIQDPTLIEGYHPLSMPMPDPLSLDNCATETSPNSLWQSGSKAFFKDQRARKVGDILTVAIDLNQEQKIEMTPSLAQNSTLSAGVSNIYGLRNRSFGVAPISLQTGAVNGLTNLLNAQSNPTLSGSGSYTVKDKLKFNMAAMVIQVLPNGSMVIEGRQELGLVNEIREINLKGVIRREDISASNTITTPKIAQLRIAYRGRGDLTDNMSAPLGHQVVNKLSPF